MATLQERAREALERLLALKPPADPTTGLSTRQDTPQAAQYRVELDAVNAEFGGSRGFQAALGGQTDDLGSAQTDPSVRAAVSTTEQISPVAGPTEREEVNPAGALRFPIPLSPTPGSPQTERSIPPDVERPLAGPMPTRPLGIPSATRSLGPPSPTSPSSSLGALTRPIGPAGAEQVVPSLGQVAQPPALAVSPPQTPEERQGLVSQWESFLSRPEVQTGLLQFALNVLQPVPSSQSPVGAVARAAAGGLQAAGRVGERERKEGALRRKEEREERALDIKESAVGATLEAARIRAGKPIAKAATLSDGTKVLRFFDSKGGQLNELPLGVDPSTIKFNLSKIRFDLAQRKEGLSVQDPLVNSFTPKQAESMLDSLSAGSENILSQLLGLGAPRSGDLESAAPPSAAQISAMSVEQINALSDAELDAIREAPALNTALQTRIDELTSAAPTGVPIQ